MRILHLTSHLSIGGITRYVLSLSKRQVHSGHQVVIAADGKITGSPPEMQGITHWQYPLRTSAEFSLPVFWSVRDLEKRLRRFPVDIVHAHTRVGQVMADQISRRLRIPYVTTWHGIYKKRLGRRLWPCAGEIAIAISDPVYNHLLQDFHIPPERVRRIYNGIETERYAVLPDPATLEEFRQRWHIPSNRPLIGSIGRLASGRVKGFDMILFMGHLLENLLPDLHVMIVGDGPRRPFLEDISRRLGISERVHFIGPVEDIRVPLALLDVFIFPSRWPEAFGLTLVEAMAAGKAVVAMKIGAVPEIVEHEVNGILVPPEDLSSLLKAVTRLLQDREMAFRLGQNAQARAREMFNLDRMAKEIEAVYREVLNH